MSLEEQLKRRRADRFATCKHFNGIQHDRCRVGVSYADLRAGAEQKSALPCLPNDRLPCLVSCAKREFPTEAEVAAREAEIQQSISRTGTAIAAVVEKLGKWKKGMGGAQGEMPCPVCKTGTLGYSRSGYNGHIWGACTTKGCVRWMQ